MGMLIVSTSLGCEGLDVFSGEDLLIADTAERFAAEVVRLLGDPELRARLSVQTRRTAERQYDWAAISYEQERAYKAAMARSS